MRNLVYLGALASFSATSAASAVHLANPMELKPCSSIICFDEIASDQPGGFSVKDWGDGTMIYMWGWSIYLSWLSSPENKDKEVTIDWLMLDTPGDSDNRTSHVVWSKNSTSASIIFQPSDNSSFWPTAAAPNMTHLQAIGYGSGRNQFRISYASSFNASNTSTYDLSPLFSNKQLWNSDAWANQVMTMESETRQEKKEIKIRYGVGIMASWFVAWLTAWFLSAWFERRRLRKNGMLFAGGNVKAGAFEQMR